MWGEMTHRAFLVGAFAHLEFPGGHRRLFACILVHGYVLVESPLEVSIRFIKIASISRSALSVGGYLYIACIHFIFWTYCGMNLACCRPLLVRSGGGRVLYFFWVCVGHFLAWGYYCTLFVCRSSGAFLIGGGFRMVSRFSVTILLFLIYGGGIIFFVAFTFLLAILYHVWI